MENTWIKWKKMSNKIKIVYKTQFFLSNWFTKLNFKTKVLLTKNEKSSLLSQSASLFNNFIYLFTSINPLTQQIENGRIWFTVTTIQLHKLQNSSAFFWRNQKSSIQFKPIQKQNEQKKNRILLRRDQKLSCFNYILFTIIRI